MGINLCPVEISFSRGPRLVPSVLSRVILRGFVTVSFPLCTDSNWRPSKGKGKTLVFIWLSLSGFWDEMLRSAEFTKHFSGSLASYRDRPLQITNNVRVKIAYQIAESHGFKPIVLSACGTQHWPRYAALYPKLRWHYSSDFTLSYFKPFQAAGWFTSKHL